MDGSALRGRDAQHTDCEWGTMVETEIDATKIGSTTPTGWEEMLEDPVRWRKMLLFSFCYSCALECAVSR